MEKSTFHSSLVALGWVILIVLLAAILVHFSWNMFAPELFNAVQISFKNAIGIVIFGFTISWVLGHGFTRKLPMSSHAHRFHEGGTAEA